MAYKLRDYQQRAVNDCIDFIRNSSAKNGIVVAPTGAGKSLIVAILANLLKEPVLCLQPSKELLEQNYEKYTSYGLEASIFSASLGVKEISNVVFATPGSVKNSIDQFRHIKYVIVDECHLGTKVGGNIHKSIRAINPKKVIGLTATPIYLKSLMIGTVLKMMVRAKDSFFKRIIHVTQIKELVNRDYWSKLLYENRYVDTSMLRMNFSGSEFTQDSISRMYTLNNTRGNLVNEIRELRKENRKSILVFVPSVEEAKELASIVDDSEWASAETKKKDRERIVKDFKAGNIKVLFNCNLFAVGFDHPELDAIITTRPTASLAIYYQQVGRGCRIADGKENCKIIDLAGNSHKFGKVENINFEDVKGFGWGMFADDKLISSVPMADALKITKSELMQKQSNFQKLSTNRGDYGTFKISFGKYKNQSVASIYTQNPQYLNWIASKDFDPTTLTAKETKDIVIKYLKTINLINLNN